MGLGVILILLGLTGSGLVRAADQITLNWGDLSPDISPDPDFEENSFIAVEDDTYFSVAADPHKDPYHGLGSSTGGLSGFSSQLFTNISNSGVDMTVYYSDNNYDGPILEGPDLYQPGALNPNPDRRVTGEYVVRMTRDHIGTRTPTTIVLSFSQPVFMDEYLIASLSVVGGSYEHAIIRAFATADATGPVVKASGFINISDLATCATLVLDQCVADGPTPTNLLSNVDIDPDLIDSDADGVYENLGSAADDGVYHVYGVIPQPTGYGRVKVVYGSEPIRSIAVSFFATSDEDPDPFTDTAYTAQWVSAIVAPHSLTPQDPTVITLNQATTSEPKTGLLIVGVALILVATITGLAFRPRRQKAI